jgi:glycosyltransferase involved in cell wall biosynthesis
MTANVAVRREGPRVTVLLPVYNGARHLRASIDSVLQQTFADLELLVVDDASTDETPSILADYADVRLRVLRNERNLGLTPTLNRGLREIGSEYVARQDADDLSDPARLAVQISHLDAHPAVALLGCAYRRIDDSGRPAGTRPVPTDALSIRWRLLFLSAFAHSSVVMRTAVLTQAGAYDESFHYAQDYELWSRIARTHAVAAVGEPLISYRRTASSLTATYAGAGAEVDAISADNIARVVAAAPTDGVDAARIDRETAWQLLFGDYRGLDPRRARVVSPLILRLQRAFAIACDLDRRTSRRHRLEVAAVLAGRLARLGARRRDGGACVTAGRLLAAAVTRR